MSPKLSPRDAASAKAVPAGAKLPASAAAPVVAPLAALSPDAARSLFSTWADPSNPPRRLAAESIKAVLGLAFFRRPDVIAAIGWKRGCGT